jgi:hypothetical protein
VKQIGGRTVSSPVYNPRPGAQRVTVDLDAIDSRNGTNGPDGRVPPP